MEKLIQQHFMDILVVSSLSGWSGVLFLVLMSGLPWFLYCWKIPARVTSRLRLLMVSKWLKFILLAKAFNPLTAEWALRALIDFTLSNARRFYSSMGNPLDGKGWKELIIKAKPKKAFLLITSTFLWALHQPCSHYCINLARSTTIIFPA